MIVVVIIIIITVKLVQSGIAMYQIYFPHWPIFRIIQNQKKILKSIKIIFHGSHLFVSENQWHWLLQVDDTCRPMLLK
jgi:hypothetical protein